MIPSTKTSLDPGGQNVIVENDRTGLTVEAIKRALLKIFSTPRASFRRSLRRTGFRSQYQKIKLANKEDLATYIQRQTGAKVNPETIFDVQVKRLHEYKRQHLNVLHIITLYNQIKRDRDVQIVLRTFIFAGKAAPGYFMARLIIKLEHYFRRGVV